jgi:aspartate aminotransferase
MATSTIEQNSPLALSKLAENIVRSEIIDIALEVNEKIKNGEKVVNLTIGDFSPVEFPIPAALTQSIIKAYQNGETNYPIADGMPELRKSVSNFLKQRGNIDYSIDEIAISGGARPLIYATFLTLIDPGDTVVFPVPSWNNNHYSYLSHAKQVMVRTTAATKFMPSAADLKPHVSEATMISLCSPLNPTGTTFTKTGLTEICDMILAENEIRKASNRKPLYLMYDQIYWALTHGDTVHYSPVELRPEMKAYTILVDGMSKSLAATGVRVGWAVAPQAIVKKMRTFLTHIGAWSPRAEQIGAAEYLSNLDQYDEFIADIKVKINDRLTAFYDGLNTLKSEGLKVDVIAPEAAIYLTVQLDLQGQKTPDGNVLTSAKEVTRYILDEAKIALVPFYAFGAPPDSSWYRLSVGTCKTADIPSIIDSLRKALVKLS